MLGILEDDSLPLDSRLESIVDIFSSAFDEDEISKEKKLNMLHDMLKTHYDA